MPASKKTTAAKKTVQLGPTLADFCEAVKGTPIVDEVTGKAVRKTEAALQVWSHALQSDEKREEIFKSGCPVNLMSMLDRGDVDDKYAAIGALCALAKSDKHATEVMNSKVLTNATNLLLSDHPRSKAPAAQLLASAAARPEYNHKVSDLATPALVEVIKADGPGWGQLRKAQLYAATALRSLIENAEGDVSEIKMHRRNNLIILGAVPALVRLVTYIPRMPAPTQLPAPLPPNLGKKKAGSKSKKDKTGVNIPQGSKDATATMAAACLRFLALCPHFVESLMSSESLEPFVGSIVSANDEQAAYICGVLWEICAEAEVAQAVAACNAVPSLLHVISRFLPFVAAKKKSSKKAKEGEPPKKEDKNAPPPPPDFPSIAICNAAGALHHLTFLDTGKADVGRCGGIAILLACLKTSNHQTYENAVGALWNCGLNAHNTVMLESAGAPEFLAQPVPKGWLVPMDPGSEPPAHPVEPSTTFLTQAASEGLLPALA